MMRDRSSSDIASSADVATIRDELQRIISSPAFEDSERLQRFLRFVTEETLQGRAARLKEAVIGVEVFGRDPAYDPKADPIVRVQARRLRAKLETYYQSAAYQSSATAEGWCISLPKGGYVPSCTPQQQPARDANIPQIPGAGVDQGLPVSGRGVKAYVGVLSVALLTAGVIAAILISRPRHPSAWTTRPFTAYHGYQTTPVFSPDGRAIAFAWGGPEDGNSAVYIQGLEADSPRRITSSPAHEISPAWMPGGQEIAFLRAVETGSMSVVVVPVLGGGERTLAQLRGVSPQENVTIAFSRDGHHLYASERQGPKEPLQVVDIDLPSQTRHVITHPAPTFPGDDELALSPDGKWIAFRRVTESSVSDVLVASVRDGSTRPITHDGQGVVGLAWTGDARALIISSRRKTTLQSLWRFPLDGGEPEQLTDPVMGASYPSVSAHDGSIAFASRFFDANIWRYDLQGTEPPRRLIESTFLDSSPRYSPDGRHIAFRSNRTGTDELWVTGANGEAPARLTAFNGPVTGNAHWSPDGHSLALDSRPDGNADVFVISSGGGVPRRFTKETSNEVLPSFSSDGKFLYFASDRSGSWQVWKESLDGGTAVEMTRAGGFAPLESDDGQWLYYTKLDTAGVFRMPVAGGAESCVVGDIPSSLWGGWGLAGDQLIYLLLRHNPEYRAEMFARSLKSGETRSVARLRFRPVLWDGALSVSKDGRYALVAEVERAGSEIHLLRKAD